MKTNNQEKTSSKVRVARMVNALTFALQSLKASAQYSDLGRRQLQDVHSVWLLGGYLYEAIHLVDDLSSAYGRSPRFAKLDAFARNIRPFREVIAEFNLNPSFTMDWGGDVTRKMIAAKGSPFFATAAQSLTAQGVMYPGVFTLDTEHFRDATDNLVTDEELDDLVKHGLVSYAEMFIDAAIKFVGERLPDNEIPVEPSPQPSKPLAFVATLNGGRVEGPEMLPEPDFRMGLVLGVDIPECHNRVPVCFGGDFDPDACEV